MRWLQTTCTRTAARRKPKPDTPRRRSFPEVQRRKAVSAVLSLTLALTVLVSGCQLLTGSNAARGLQGKIVWPKDGNLWVYDLASGQQKEVVELPPGAAVTGATWSPDGNRLIYAQFWRRPNDRSSGADLFVANPDGSDPHLFAERDAANTVRETPEWMPSGRV